MASLREKMTRHGFESNDDYEYQVRCLLRNGGNSLRCLNIQGDSDRRKTAFATALAHALEYPRVLYHDFTQQHPFIPDPILPPSRDEQGRQAAPIEPFDQILSEACAFSEAEDTLLILDQLQTADFREHLRIYRFLENAQWQLRDTVYYANPAHLVVFLISEAPLYHSLQRLSFRVWVNRTGHFIRYRPEEFGLGEDAWPLLEALGELFIRLGAAPTRGEYAHLLYDVQWHIRTSDGLRHSLYGWTEGVVRELLYARELEPLIHKAMTAIEQYLGVDEVEISSP